MSRIDDLIAELCPDGVPFEAIGSLIRRGSNVKWGDQTDEEFMYIDLTSVDRVTHAISATETITSDSAPSRAQQIVRKGDVLFGTTRPMLKRYCTVPSELDGQIASTGYCVLRPDPARLLSNYLFHILGTASFYAFVEANQRGASYPAIPDSVVKQFRVPVPSLEVQREVAEVLDQFTKLEAELEAELEARRKQYEYYRNSLLTFPESGGVPRVPMGEFAQLVRGNGMPKADFVDDGVPAIHYGQIYTHYGTWTTATMSYVTPSTASKLAKVDPGDIVITNTSENVEDVGKAVAWLGNEQAITGGHATVIKHHQNSKYLAYYFRTVEFDRDTRRYANGTKVVDVSAKSLAKIEVPLPSHDEQDRIVSVLDNFDALTNDLSVGLPAELAARRKQYEYYRDRLLTFEELAA